MSQTASSSKLNFRYVGSPIVLYWEGHNPSIRNKIKVNEHLMESLFHKLSNRCGSTSISRQQGLQIVTIFCHCFCRELLYHHGHVFILETLAQVGADLKEKEKPSREPLDVFLLGHHLKRPARSFKPSQRPNPYQVRVHLGSRAPGPACSKTDAQDTSGLCFWWSTYGWKDNCIS